MAVAGRLLDLRRGAAGGARRARAVPPSPRDAPVRLEGVSFAYPDRGATCSTASTSSSRPGETVALVGASGARQEHARVAAPAPRRADGGPRDRRADVDLAACDAAAWRAQLAWVPQRADALPRHASPTTSASATPARRRARARGGACSPAPTTSSRRCPTATRRSSATAAGRSRRASARRIALARAFLRDAPLVILDEPTADLDPESAELVGEAVERLREGRTVLADRAPPGARRAAPTASSRSPTAGSSSTTAAEAA